MCSERINLFPESSDINKFCFVIKNCFTEKFCNDIIERYKNAFKSASTHYPGYYRNNKRCVIDNDKLANDIFKKICHYVPKYINDESKDSEKWKIEKLNSRIRICRYDSNEMFNKHLDGIHFESPMIRSKLTFIIYLNDQQSNFVGGRTLFFNSKLDDTLIQSYKPHQGDVMIFDHNIWHSGELVTNGTKYILRSDIMYKNMDINYYKNGERDVVDFKNAHMGYIWGINTFNDKIISYGRDKCIKIWSKTDEYVDLLKGHRHSVICAVQISPKILISGSRDSTIKIWKNFELIGTLNKIHHDTVLSLSKLNDTHFVSVGSDGMLNIINCNDGNILITIKAHNNWIWKVCVISINDENESIDIVTISEDGTLKIWNINILNKKIKKINEWKNEQNVAINCIDVNKKKKQLFIGTFNGMIKILKYDTNYSMILIDAFYAHKGIVRCIKIEKRLIYSGGEDNTIYAWNLNINDNKYKKVWQYKHKNFVQDILLREHDLLSVSYDGSICRHSKIHKINHSKL